MAGFTQWTIDGLPGMHGLPPENPVPIDAAPRPEGSASKGSAVGPSKGESASASSLLAFDIRTTSQAAAQAAMEVLDGLEVAQGE